MHDSIMHSIGTPRRATASLLMVWVGRCVAAYKLYGPSDGVRGVQVALKGIDHEPGVVCCIDATRHGAALGSVDIIV